MFTESSVNPVTYSFNADTSSLIPYWLWFPSLCNCVCEHVPQWDCCMHILPNASCEQTSVTVSVHRMLTQGLVSRQPSHPDSHECQYMDFCSGYLSSAFTLYDFMTEHVLRYFSPLPLLPGPDGLPSKDVMRCREEAKFNHYSSHDCSTNAAIQEQVSLKLLICNCACASWT